MSVITEANRFIGNRSWGAILAGLKKRIGNLKADLGYAAASCASHGVVHRDPRRMTDFIKILNVNDQTAFRRWIGANFVYLTEEGETKPIFRWSEKDGFAIVAKADAYDKADFTFESVLSFGHFMDINVAAEAKPIDLLKLLSLLKNTLATVQKKAEGNDITLPRELVADMGDLASTVSTLAAHAEAAKAQQARMIDTNTKESI